jgi:hypothetical protein
MRYFDYFPDTEYKNFVLTDITRRTKFRDVVKTRPYVFLPYTIEDGLRPEDVANYYYGSPRFTWIVYMSNDIIDPYKDWPMTEEVFIEYFKKKYAIPSEREGQDVLDWGQNATITENIAYYLKEDALNYPKENYENMDLTMTNESFQYLADNPGVDTDFIASEWRAIRMLEHERIENEKKRNIFLISKRYRDQIVNEFKRFIND